MKFLKGIVGNNLFLFLILIVIPFRFYNITNPLMNITNFRQAQTATVALNFHKNGINLFQTELDIFGIGKERYLTLEFPLYEAIVAMFYKIFFVSDMWGRVVSTIFGFLGGWYLYRLIILICKNKIIALLTCFFYFFAPLNMYHQRDFLIEATVVAFLLIGSYYFCYWVNYQNKKSYFLSIIFLSLGFIQKGMYGPFWYLPLVWYYKKRFSIRYFFSLNFVFLIILPLIALFLWQQQMNYVNTLNGHEYFTTINKDHLLWNLGSITERLSVSQWLFRYKNILNGILLKPGIVLLILGIIAARERSFCRFFYLWLVSEVIYFLIFFKIQSHIYYQMVMIPVIAFFMTIGLLQLGKAVNDFYKRLNLLKLLTKYIKPIFLTMFCAFFIWKSWLNSQWDTAVDLKWYERLQMVGKSVPANSYGIFVTPGYDWNSVYTYYPKLKMIVVGAEDVSPENVIKWKNLGYSYMILHEYEKYPNYLKEVKAEHTLEFIKNFKEILMLEDFKVYLFRK